jgi:hypothetical protein
MIVSRKSVLWRLGLVLIGFLSISDPVRAQVSSQSKLSTPQLEQLVAPIALYPDTLLSQVLMASTYPTEVVQAARWSHDNAGLKGKALEDALQSQPWDPSVKALAAVPQTLQMMSDKLDWTQQLGDAFLAQQPELLRAVQTLRARADAAGNLKTTPQQTVTKVARTSSGGSSGSQTYDYTIASADPDLCYVPIYDPGLIYGPWPYADYAPWSWYPPGYVATGLLSFAAGVAVGAAIWGRVDWRRNRVDIDINRYNRFNRTNIANNVWAHNPAHRHNVAYKNPDVAARFADKGKVAAREGYRAQAEAGRRNLNAQTTQRSASQKARSAAGAGQKAKSAASRQKVATKARHSPRSVQHRPAASPRVARSHPRPMARPHARISRSMGHVRHTGRAGGRRR